MSGNQQSDQRFPLKLSPAQRKALAEVLPAFADRLKLDEPNIRLVLFTLAEMSAIHQDARLALRHTASGMKRNSLRHVAFVAQEAIKEVTGIGRIPAKVRLYQLRISLKHITPPIWRRIQTRDCTLDKLHERIQMAMGWTNSHFHHFLIDETLYGDPLVIDDFDEFGYKDSTVTTLSDVVPKSGERYRFEYEYDFGDSWWHDVLFEGCLRDNPGERYPLCLEGERACPPEDVGGTSGYKQFLRVIAGPDRPRRRELLTWVGGSFDPEKFDAERATKKMLRSLPKWRETAYDGEE